MILPRSGNDSCVVSLVVAIRHLKTGAPYLARPIFVTGSEADSRPDGKLGNTLCTRLTEFIEY